MTNEFSRLNLRPQLVETVAELGYTIPTDVQTQVIPLMLDWKGYDCPIPNRLRENSCFCAADLTKFNHVEQYRVMCKPWS